MRAERERTLTSRIVIRACPSLVPVQGETTLIAQASKMSSTRTGLVARRQHQHAVRGGAIRAQARRSLPPNGRGGGAHSPSSSSGGGFDVAKSSSAGRSSSTSPPSPSMASSAAASSSASRGAAAAARQQPVLPTPPQQPSRPAPGVLRVAIDVDEGEFFGREKIETEKSRRRREH